MLHTWARKAQGYGISLIPVPSDPFALPITLNSDPVRGPIFIEMDTEVISFNNFPESSWDQRLFLFREAIAHKFGFINSATERKQQPSSAMFSTHHQYIHCTGNMFLLIPTQLQLQAGLQVKYFANDSTFLRFVNFVNLMDFDDFVDSIDFVYTVHFVNFFQIAKFVDFFEFRQFCRISSTLSDFVNFVGFRQFRTFCQFC